MTLVEMRTRVRNLIRDDSASFTTNAEIDQWINEAQIDLAHRVKYFRSSASVTFTANAAPLPADFIEPVSLRIGTIDVRWVDDDEFNDYSDSGSSPPTTIGRIFGANIEVYPTPSAGTGTLRYIQSPTALTADANTSTLPDDFDYKMVYFAAKEAFDKLQDYDSASRYEQKYERGLPPRSFAQRFKPGPMEIGFEPNVIDLEGSHVT